MTLRTTVSTLARGAVRTSYSVARHPVASTRHATGVAKATVGMGVDVVRALAGNPAPPPATARTRAHLPGPDTVAKPVPRIGDLPEPVVIEAED